MDQCKDITPEIRVGDVDTAFVFCVSDLSSDVYDPSVDCEPPPLDVSTATLEMHFQKPDGTTVTVAATLVGTGEDGKIQYRTVSGFLDQDGQWKRQGLVTIPPGSWKTNIVCFTVHANLVA